MIVIGLMSGTSADGVDAAIMRLAGTPPRLRWTLLHHYFRSYPDGLRSEVLLGSSKRATVDRICRLNFTLGEFYAAAVCDAIAEAGIDRKTVKLIGCHGQTLWHDPPFATFQVGEPGIVAERTGIQVVSNFRSRDMAAGGQGAPLVAYVDQLLFQSKSKTRALQNLGGIGNVTFLPKISNSGIKHRDGHSTIQPVALAFDTGPANMVIDDIARRASNGTLQCDQDGRMAAAGTVHGGLLEELLGLPFFAKHPPKSTGRELFGEHFGQDLWQRMGVTRANPNDLAATATMMTAVSIAEAYRNFLPIMPDEVIVSGGGVRNPTLMRMLAECIKAIHPETLIKTSDSIGMPAEAKEAACFAVLAYETMHGRPGNLPGSTGAGKRVVLGDITPA